MQNLCFTFDPAQVERARRKKDIRRIMPNIFSGADHHVARRISEEPLSQLPFEHCVVDNIFPPALFEAIQDKWPSDSVLKPLPETGRSTGYPERQVMLFTPDFMDKLSSSDQQFWIQVAQIAMGKEVVVSCYNKFKSILQPRIAHIGGNLFLDAEMQVVSDRKGYEIGPHTDSPQRFISLLYYLSPEPEYESYGTGLYQPKDSFKPTNYRVHHGFEDFELHTRVDFRPNRLVVFPRSDISYHGVEPVHIEACDRRLFIVNVRAPEGAR